jgi:hypothetical protein
MAFKFYDRGENFEAKVTLILFQINDFFET